MTTNQSFFKDPKTIANHILSRDEEMSHIRIQTLLYFVYAFYGASYGQEDNYPNYLFNGSFETWRYGVRLPSIVEAFHNEELVANEWIPQTPQEIDVHIIIEDVLDAYEQFDDFQLVDIMHDEEMWNKYYVETEHKDQTNSLIDSDDLIQNYIQFVTIT